MASEGQTGKHIPQPLHTELLIMAIDFVAASVRLMASNGQASEHALHHVQVSGLTTATIGSVSSSPLLTYEYDFVAARFEF